MTTQCRARRGFATACGLIVTCCLCAGSSEARAGLFRHLFLLPNPSKVDCAPPCAVSCCETDPSPAPGSDPDGAAILGDPAAGDPPGGDPGGGPGPGSQLQSTGSASGGTAVGAGGNISNRGRRASPGGFSGIGGGGLGGGAFLGGG